MPTLPTLTVTQAQADRMLATYGDVATYKEWLRVQIIDYVLRSEAQALDEQHNTTKGAALASLAAEMPGPAAP